MKLSLLARVLWNRRKLRERDHWSRAQIEAHQARDLEGLRAFAYAELKSGQASG